MVFGTPSPVIFDLNRFPKNMAEEYLETEDPVRAPDDVVESKREALSILVSLGSTKKCLGAEMSLGDIKKLPTKDVEKYHLRYQTILGRELSSSLVDSVVLVASKAISMIVSIDDADQLYQDLKSDKMVKRELKTFAGLLILKGGRLVAPASAFFQVAKHMNIGKSQQTQEGNQDLEQTPRNLLGASEEPLRTLLGTSYEPPRNLRGTS